MKSSEILVPWADYNQSKAVDNIIEHLTWGETIPCVSGGNGGCGYEDYKVDENDLDKTREYLNGLGYNNDPEVADDFKANDVVFKDYTGCVQFNQPNGGWLQFLLW